MTAAIEHPALGVECTLVVTDVDTLGAASRLFRHRVAEVDATASRFRADSEVSRLATLPGIDGLVTERVSPLLRDLVADALWAADATDGLVDPTLGRAMEAAGYDTDLAEVLARDPRRTPSVGVGSPAGSTLADLSVDDAGTLTMAAGCLLDLGSTGKASTADRIARELAATLPGGFLVDLGGDIALSGEPPAGGWVVTVDDGRGLALTTQGVATSGTDRRRWVVDGQPRHHLLDPATARPVQRTWSQVTCLGATALEANAASTAACVLGDAAPMWLIGRRIPARLQPQVGTVICTPGWPAPVPQEWAS
ncbi:FAD:protein FMN transferase [Calidifontibacter terrae]